MPFIPHTEQDISDMLSTIGVDKVDDLFDEIPASLRSETLAGVPHALSEMEVRRHMYDCAAKDGLPRSFLGAGAYEHHIPSAVWQVTTRGEFYSAYTPYQAEASQGTLQLIYEYQTMMCALTGMDVSNASLYDGASGLAEASLMAIRGNRKSKSKRLLVAGAIHPFYREVAKNITKGQGLEFVEVPFAKDAGSVNPDALREHEGQDFAAMVIAQPNFFGVLEQVDRLTDWAHEQNMLVIAVVNPISLGLLKAPGQWGQRGADIVCGEGQPLGVPVSSGGPYFGFMTARKELVRQMPGRIVGRTVDLDGKPGFTLTLQAREQHIRRSRATSNICTNQGLMVTAATIYMAILGAEGLRRVGASSHSNLATLLSKLQGISGVEKAFTGTHFHEAVVLLDRPPGPVLAAMANMGFVAGLDLATFYPDMGHAMLVCCTETKTESDIDDYVDALAKTIQAV